MHHTLKLTQIGHGVGVVLPEDALSRLRLEVGQTVLLTETSEGQVLTPFNPEQAQQVDAGRPFMKEFRDTFHWLGT